jgi:molecular chaperone GrpE
MMTPKETKEDMKVKNERRTEAMNEQETPSLEMQLAEKEEQILSYIDRLQRLQAEFENYKKRVLREMANLEERVADREILDVIPLYDNLVRAFESFSGNKDSESFVHGIEKIYAQFDQILKTKGVSSVEAVGRLFDPNLDPNLHDALLSVPSDEERNVILEEFERGYLRNDRLLRPCKVKVSGGREEEKEDTT